MRRLNAVQEAIVSSAVAGAAVGAALGGAASDRVGRKPVLLAADALFALGAALMAAARGVPVLIAGRVASGLGIGLASVVVPVYIAVRARPHLGPFSGGLHAVCMRAAWLAHWCAREGAPLASSRALVWHATHAAACRMLTVAGACAGLV